jgi:hexokinase
MTDDPCADELRALFVPTPDRLRDIAGAFARAIADGLAGRPSSLAMLPSFLAPPTGGERGLFLALDFGGTNVRALEVELRGRDGPPRVRGVKARLVDPDGRYDHVAASSTAAELFAFLAAHVRAVARPGVRYRLGHTFSFPCAQTARDRARLLHWTKEIRTRGVEGEDVGLLLARALADAGLPDVEPVVILNDTVGTLLAAAHRRADVRVGAICGTGHNACYVEPRHPRTGGPMIVNLESGNFDGAPPTRFDLELDRASERPGEQRLEKMVAGKYLGELLRLVLADLHARGRVRLGGAPVAGPVRGGAVVLGELLAAGDDHATAARALAAACGWNADAAAVRAAQTASACILQRSAAFAAATFAGAVRHIDPELQGSHVVAIDGSIYGKEPGYAAHVQRTLDALGAGARGSITAELQQDGSGLGAAIAAATA